MKQKKKRGLEQELAELAAALDGPEPRAALASALASERSFLVERAAEKIRALRIDGLGSELCAAFDRFFEADDPGCRAKLACLEALDFTEHHDSDPFVRGAKHVQMEAAWPKAVDVAVGLRARGILGLARLGWPDTATLAGEMLGDPEPPVRQAAADALGCCRDGASALALKLRLGDPDPIVTMCVLKALIEQTPDYGLAAAERSLRSRDEALREAAALALGQSRSEGALAILCAALEACTLSSERAVLLRAAAMHRSDRALDAVLAYLVGTNAHDAKAAIAALRVRRFEPSVVARVRACAPERLRAEVDAAFAE